MTIGRGWDPKAVGERGEHRGMGAGGRTESAPMLRRSSAPFAYSGSVSETVSHMTPDEFRRRAHQAVDFIADYWRGVEKLPVLCPLRPGETAAKMPPAAPEKG